MSGGTRHVAAAGGVVNILMMDGCEPGRLCLGTRWRKAPRARAGLDRVRCVSRACFNNCPWLADSAGWTFTLFSCFCLFVAVQVMFEYREEERRRGVDRKC